MDQEPTTLEDSQFKESKRESFDSDSSTSTDKGLLGGGSPTVKEKTTKRKVVILLKATGDAPILKIRKLAVESDMTIASVIEVMKKPLKLSPSDNLFLYVNRSFAPSPDQILLNLYECFGSDGRLVLHYSKTPAWG